LFGITASILVLPGQYKFQLAVDDHVNTPDKPVLQVCLAAEVVL
jgi:hypothetical protein